MIIKAKPFVKWVGGKTQLINSIEKTLPKNFHKQKGLTYLEPFVGGGAILFWILQQYPNITKAVINDINPDLISAYKTIKENPDAKILILSGQVDETSLLRTVKAGAKAYVSKDAGTDELIEAITAVYNNEEYFGGKISKLLFKTFSKLNSDNPTHQNSLSERETEVLKLFADGLTYKEIGEKLFISPRTVETHKNSIMSKLGLKTLADLIKWAIRNGVIQI